MTRRRAKVKDPVKDNKSLIGSILRKLRRNKDLSQAEVAASIGFSRPTPYQKYEAGTVIPPADKLAKLAELFSVSVDELLGREPAMTLHEESTPYRMLPIDAVGAELAFREIVKATEADSKKLAELRKLLEEFRSKL